jgi:hypothetical protein
MSWRALMASLGLLALMACGGEAESNASAVPVAADAPTTSLVDSATTSPPTEAPTTIAAPTVAASAVPAVTAVPTTRPAPTLPAPIIPAPIVPATTVVSASSSPTTVPATTAAPTTAAPTTAAPTTAAPAPTTTVACRVVESGDTVRRGDCGELVRFIQERLTVLGFPAVADGLFGPGTEAAVKNFQASRGLTADGLVGPATWAALVEGGIGD